MAIFRNIMAFIGGLAIVLGAIFGFGMLNKDFRTFVCSFLGAVPQQEYQLVIEEKDNLMLQLKNTTVEMQALTNDRDNIIQERDNLLMDIDNLNNEINNLVMERTYYEDRIRMLEDDLIMNDDRIEQYRQEIDMLNDEIFMLNDEIMRLHDDIRFYDDEIMRLNDEISSLLNEIDNLNLEIDRLNNELMTISITLDNATLQFVGSYSRIEYIYYNEEDGGNWHMVSTGSEINDETFFGSDVPLFLERYEQTYSQIAEIWSRSDSYANLYNSTIYNLIIDGRDYIIDTDFNIERFEITQNTNFEIKYLLNGVEMTRDELIGQIVQDRNYFTSAEYSYSLNQDNTVANVICEINIDLDA